ncbi:MAG: sulfite exporter TauE/SafE family protein [Paracoccaceae bacterium]
MFEIYSAPEVLFIFAIYFMAASAKGVTGLGFSTMCLAPLALVVGLKSALPLLIIPSISTNIMVMVGVGHFGATIRRFWPMLLATVPGLLVGLWLLDSVNGGAAGAVLGLVLLLFVAFSWSRPDMRLPATWERPLQPVSGALTGLVNGVTGSQVMPSMPFMMSLHLERNMFVQAINCSFTLSSMIMVAGLAKLGLMTWEAVIVSTIGTAFALIGIRVGERIRDQLSPDQFRIGILAVLSVMGLALIAKGI